MALLNSLFSGVSGLQNLQSMMDVIGNNIANVDTIGFKSSRVTFSDTFNQLIKSGTNPTDSTGGTNSFQIGLGMKVNSIDRNWNQGTFQTTGITTDLALQGPGMFILNSNGQNFYSRAGAFEFDSNGKLVDPQNGAVVQGKVANGLGQIPSGTTLQNIVIDKNLRLPAIKTTQTTWGGNLNSASPLINVVAESGNLNITGTGAPVSSQPAGQYSTITDNKGNTYQYQSSYTYANGTWTFNYQINDSTGKQISTGSKALTFDPTSGKCTNPAFSVNPTGTDLNFNVNLSALTTNTNATSIIAPTATYNGTNAQVNGAVTIYDSLGNPHTLTITYTHVDTNKWTWEASIPSADGSLSSGNLPSGTITFTPNGEIQSITQDGNPNPIPSGSFPTIEFTPSSGADVQDISLDLGSGTSGITQTSLNSQVAALSQNGSPSSSLTNINIDQYGNIVGVFSNGNSRTLAQIMVATFENQNGLVSTGDNMYSVAANSGDPRIDTPGENSATTIQSGALEQSNVDLSQEFTNMIVSQRGFEANAKVVTTSDQLLQDITNLIR